jgi:tricorn protease
VRPALPVSILTAFSLTLLAAGNSPLEAQTSTRLLAEPAISADHIAFVYDTDLWIANRDGSSPRRLTTHPGLEGNARFSPDGRHIAFTGEYDGNADAFVVPVEGGAPQRLTWHPTADIVQGWTTDGSAVAFVSNRKGLQANNGLQLLTASVEGGLIGELEVPYGFAFSISPDAQRIAYTPAAPAMQQWKNYRGGRVSRIWIADRATLDVEEVPQPEGRSNDLFPMWVGETLYFVSDRAGEFNLFRHGEAGPEQLTEYDEFPILSATAGSDGTIVYEQAGWLHTFDPATGAIARVDVSVTTDLMETRPRWVDGSDFIQTAGISPSGVRAVFEARGEIVTVPEENGDVRVLTETSGVHERSPAWSPDGGSIAFFSDASGEYQLHIAPADALDEARAYPIDGAGFYRQPKWSPDGEWIVFEDNAFAVHVLEVESGDVTTLGAVEIYGPFDGVDYAWSPDSEWLAYTLTDANSFGRLHVWSTSTGETEEIGTGLGHITTPAFDRSGKYLYFYASTDAGPVQSWFDMSNNDMEAQGTLYMAILDPSLPSPLAPDSDEEPAPSADEAPGENEPAESGDAVNVDFDDIEQRIVPLGVGNGWFAGLETGEEGQLFYLRRASSGPAGGPPSLRRFDLGSGEESVVLAGAAGFQVSADGSKLLVAAGGGYHIAPAGPPVDAGDTRIATGDIRIRVDPRQEWRQMLREIWRQQRDWFYDPGMHGADWDDMWDRYAQFVPALATRADLNRVTQWMLSELAVGHSRGGGGDFIRDADNVPGGLLGADFEADAGLWRIARIYRGENWNPGLRAPLAEPGLNIQEGDYLLAVDGDPLTLPDNPYAPFEARADAQVSITVGPNADGSDSRTVTIRPTTLGGENNLRLRSWIDDRTRRVREATDGRVAYVWVPNTGAGGWDAFKRYFFPQADAEAIIVDERFNGGGQLADYVIDLLDREYASSWAFRYGEDLHVPQAAVLGPKVMLVNEWAGSGGDYMPWLFRQRDLGTLIGKRTWGGLVGILETPLTLDGASWTAPNLGFWTEDEGFGIENEGIPPDIDVEQWPAEVAAGGDPQLERAIALILQQLEQGSVADPERPPFPTRSRGGN